MLFGERWKGNAKLRESLKIYTGQIYTTDVVARIVYKIATQHPINEELIGMQIILREYE